MKLLRRLWSRLTGRRGEADRELDDELREYVRLLTEEKLAEGMRPSEARRAALVESGGVEQLKENVRDVRVGNGLEIALMDLRYGVRSLARTPGFTLAAVMALALGIGATAAVFSVVDAVLIRPLGYAEPERLVTLLHGEGGPVAPANFLDWQSQSESFTKMGAAEYWSPNLTGRERPERLRGLRVTPEIFPMLGVAPVVGRVLSMDAEAAEAVVSWDLWQRRWAGNAGVIGTTLRLDGQEYTVVGVMPRGFDFAPFWATGREVWAPASLAGRASNRGGQSLRVFAQLAPGVSVREAATEMAAITARLEAAYPATNRDVRLTSLREMVVRGVRPALLVLSGAVALLLLIACANVAHMMLARATAREREVSVRTALGAGRSRLVRQFMTEGLVLSLAGCAAGLAVAAVAVRALIVLGSASIPRIAEVSLDLRAAGIAAAISIATGVIFGLVPLARPFEGATAQMLREDARGASSAGRLGRARNVLVASEYALALVLLVGAGLLVRSFVALQAVDPGFDASNVLSMVVSVQDSPEGAPGRRAAFYRELLDRTRSLPGVESAGGINHLPIGGDIWGLSFFIEGRPRPQPGEKPNSTYRVVLPGYFETMRLSVVRGRAIDERDAESAQPVVVVNEALASRYWPGGDAIGKRISYADPEQEARWLTVIGVVRNAVQYDWTGPPAPEVYLPLFQTQSYMENPSSHFAYVTVVARTTADPAALAPALRNAVWSIDRNLPVSEVRTMAGVVSEATAQPRFNAALLGGFAAVALLLAAVGIYGVMSYVVARRTREIGIRMALGARDAQIISLVVKQGMATAAAGASVGLVAAFLMRRFMSGLLYGIGPSDPATFTLVPAVLGLVALLASWVPARRALAMNPVRALRDE